MRPPENCTIVIQGRDIIPLIQSMEDVFFTESSEAPVPPGEVRIRILDAVPRPDGRRIDVRTEITPFQQRPNVELVIRNDSGDESATLSVVEAMEAAMDFTMHLREKEPAGKYSLEMRVFYTDIEAHEAAEGEEVASAEILEKASYVVDQQIIEFQI